MACVSPTHKHPTNKLYEPYFSTYTSCVANVHTSHHPHCGSWFMFFLQLSFSLMKNTHTYWFTSKLMYFMENYVAYCGNFVRYEKTMKWKKKKKTPTENKLKASTLTLFLLVVDCLCLCVWFFSIALIYHSGRRVVLLLLYPNAFVVPALYVPICVRVFELVHIFWAHILPP